MWLLVRRYVVLVLQENVMPEWVRGEFLWKHLRGREVLQQGHEKNLITRASRQVMADLVRGAAYESGVKVLSIGTSSTAPTIDDAKLGNELYRQTIPPADTNDMENQNTVTTSGIIKTTIVTTLEPYGALPEGYLKPAASSPMTIHEIGFYARLTTLTDPASAMTFVQEVPGSLPGASSEVYSVIFVWANGNSQTAASPEVNHTMTATGGIELTIPGPFPAEADRIKIYIEKDSSGTHYFQDEVDLTEQPSAPHTYQRTTAISEVGADTIVLGGAGDVNTTGTPGVTDGGTLFNHALIAQPGGVTLVDGAPADRLQVTAIWTFG